MHQQGEAFGNRAQQQIHGAVGQGQQNAHKFQQNARNGFERLHHQGQSAFNQGHQQLQDVLSQAQQHA